LVGVRTRIENCKLFYGRNRCKSIKKDAWMFARFGSGGNRWGTTRDTVFTLFAFCATKGRLADQGTDVPRRFLSVDACFSCPGMKTVFSQPTREETDYGH